jgi:hypothetical protein
VKGLPTLGDIRHAHGVKREYERYLPLSRYVFRPLGFAVTWLALRLGVTSEAVSWLSAAVGLLGLAGLMSAREGVAAAGLGLLLLFNLLDCVDGSIARAMGTGNPYGRFLDSICGGVVDLGFWAAVGVMAFRHPDLLAGLAGPSDPAFWLAVGGVTCFLAVLLHEVERAYEQFVHAAWEAPDGGEPTAGAAREPWLKTLARNLRVRETQYALLALAMVAGAVDVLLAGYLLYYLAHVLTALRVYAARGRAVRARARGAPAPAEKRAP